MLAGDFLDGNVADWNIDKDDRCLCDVEATIVYRLSMRPIDFERGLERLDRRRSARAEFVRRKLYGSGRGLGVIDANAMFEANDAFEDLFGREPLDAFLNDADEVVHRCLGAFFAEAIACGAMTSPVTAGAAFKTVPARSFDTAKAMVAHQRGQRAKWTPSVRTEITFILAGSVASISSALSSFSGMMSECGVVTRCEQSMRKPDLAGIPHRIPVLAEVMGDGTRKAHQMK